MRRQGEEEEGEEEEGEEEEGEEEEDDDDDEEGELDFERKARQTVARMERMAAENQAELREQMGDRVHGLPTAAEIAEEQTRAPDVTMVRERIKEVVDVLSDFKGKRAPGRTRDEYMTCLGADLGTAYGYNNDLVGAWQRRDAVPARALALTRR